MDTKLLDIDPEREWRKLDDKTLLMEEVVTAWWNYENNDTYVKGFLGNNYTHALYHDGNRIANTVREQIAMTRRGDFYPTLNFTKRLYYDYYLKIIDINKSK